MKGFASLKSSNVLKKELDLKFNQNDHMTYHMTKDVYVYVATWVHEEGLDEAWKEVQVQVKVVKGEGGVWVVQT